MVFFDAFGADGLEGPKADVECNLGGFDSPSTDAGENPGGEVKTGGGGGDGSALMGVDGLVAFAVSGGIFAGDVGRKRDVSDLVDAGEKIVDGVEADAALSERSAGDDFGAERAVFSEEETLADIDLAAGTNETFPFVGVLPELAGKKNFDASVKKVVRGGVTVA